MPRKRNTSIEVEALWQLWPHGQAALAGLVGLSHGAFRVHSSRGFQDAVIRARIESVVGAAVWTDARTFKRRRHCEATLGFDPYTLRSDDLLAQAAKLPLRSRPSRLAELSEQILNHAAPLKPHVHHA